MPSTILNKIFLFLYLIRYKDGCSLSSIPSCAGSISTVIGITLQKILHYPETLKTKTVSKSFAANTLLTHDSIKCLFF